MVNKKKRGQPDVEDIIARLWCYYCERDFDDQHTTVTLIVDGMERRQA